MPKYGDFIQDAKDAVGDVVFYPIEHPVETAKLLTLGALTVAATVFTAQASIAISEHGGIWQGNKEGRANDY